jgi:PilZ domain
MAQKQVPLPAEIRVVARSNWDKRRVEARYHCGPATLGQVLIVEQVENLRGWILDLSANGAGLLLAEPLAPDTLFVLHLKSTNGDRRYELPGRVVHATTQPSGDWLIGCRFADPLTADDLDALL